MIFAVDNNIIRGMSGVSIHPKSWISWMKNLQMKREKDVKNLREQNKDIEKETEKMRLTQFVVDNITDDTVNHQLKMERDRLERELGREVREHQREKEAMERDFEQRIFILNLKHEKELRNANGGRNESQSKVEDPKDDDF